VRDRPVFETELLALRPLSGGDLDAVHRISNDPLVRRYLWDDQPVSKGAVEGVISRSLNAFAEDGFGLFGVRLRDGGGELIGYCGLLHLGVTERVELLYALLPAWWGRGLATEAARACLRFAFEEAGLERLVAGTDPPNTASLRVIQKLGMTPIGELRPGVPYFELTREDFRVSEAKDRGTATGAP
jgi:[ribosomal protein S5]-alanine N-acetyltransferase